VVLHCDALARCKDNHAAHSAHIKIAAFPPRPCYDAQANWLHTAGVEFMKKLVEIRSQEFICRERAMRDSERKIFWLAQAEEWEQRALDEIAFHFRECNLESGDPQTAAY
jgi:hypothetical protein